MLGLPHSSCRSSIVNLNARSVWKMTKRSAPRTRQRSKSHKRCTHRPGAIRRPGGSGARSAPDRRDRRDVRGAGRPGRRSGIAPLAAGCGLRGSPQQHLRHRSGHHRWWSGFAFDCLIGSRHLRDCRFSSPLLGQSQPSGRPERSIKVFLVPTSLRATRRRGRSAGSADSYEPRA